MLKLEQDFQKDFDSIMAAMFDESAPKFAFVRFADGELAFMRGRRHQAKSDGWLYDGRLSHPMHGMLLDALYCNAPGYYLGLPCPCHDPDDYNWTCREILGDGHTSKSRVTFASVFIYGNYTRFLQQFARSKATLVGPFEVKFTAPFTGLATNNGQLLWDHRPFVDQLIQQADSAKPIAVAAGPLANVIIHDYWTRCPIEKRATIVDCGSALDTWTRGRRTRQYQRPDSPRSMDVCQWTR